ncbi:hypothetical protein D3C87_259560 [compost metagenome]
MKYKLHVVVFSFWAVFSVLSISLIQGTASLTPNPGGRWILTHIVDPESYKGQRIIQHLLKREATPQYDEVVVFLIEHSNLESQLEKKGFVISHRSFEEIKRQEPRVVSPFFLITSPRGEGVYAGAYSDPIQDLALIKSFFSTQSLSYFPIYGCGNSVRIQKALDPQGILFAKRKVTSPRGVL